MKNGNGLLAVSHLRGLPRFDLLVLGRDGCDQTARIEEASKSVEETTQE